MGLTKIIDAILTKERLLEKAKRPHVRERLERQIRELYRRKERYEQLLSDAFGNITERK